MGIARSSELSRFHLANCKEKGQFEPWWQYHHVLDILKALLTEEEWHEFNALTREKYSWVIQNVESKFLVAAEEIIDGRRAASEAFDQAREILSAVAISQSDSLK
jgi:hypothetical protein